MFFVHQIITPFTLSCVSLKNFIYQNKKRKMSMPKGMREKIYAKEREEKKKKERKK
jgi:hypothetical protein